MSPYPNKVTDDGNGNGALLCHVTCMVRVESGLLSTTVSTALASNQAHDAFCVLNTSAPSNTIWHQIVESTQAGSSQIRKLDILIKLASNIFFGGDGGTFASGAGRSSPRGHGVIIIDKPNERTPQLKISSPR